MRVSAVTSPNYRRRSSSEAIWPIRRSLHLPDGKSDGDARLKLANGLEECKKKNVEPLLAGGMADSEVIDRVFDLVARWLEGNDTQSRPGIDARRSNLVAAFGIREAWPRGYSKAKSCLEFMTHADAGYHLPCCRRLAARRTLVDVSKRSACRLLVDAHDVHIGTFGEIVVQ